MIAVDWGTSSFRAWRLGPDGSIDERLSAPAGILGIAPGEFPDTLDRLLAGWPDEAPVVMCGMVGSRQGWREIPYAECPAGPAEIAGGLRSVERGDGRRAWIAPGLVCRDTAGVPDVMRGEETQIIGALDRLPEDAVLCLPGTHSKWARVTAGRIAGFATAMTGEIFAVLRRHSILGRLMPAGETAAGTGESRWFRAGLERAGEAGGLLHHLFGVRSRGLFGEVPEDGLAAYLSGILIGREIADLAPADGPVHVLGTKALAELYGEALAALGRECRILDPESAARGLHRLAAHLPTGDADD